MAKPGFKVITIQEYIYDYYDEVFKSNKERLALKGIHSLTAYVVYTLEESLKRDLIFSKYSPKIKKISIEKERILLKDELKDRIIEILIQKRKLFCTFCQSEICLHIGFCYSIHQLYGEVWK